MALNTIIIEIRLVNTFREILLYHVIIYVIFLPVVIQSLIIMQLLHCHLLLTCHSGEVYSVQHYVKKSVGDLRKVRGFFRVLRFPQTNQTNRHDIAEILFESGAKHHNHRHKISEYFP